ncbi:MAG: AI-2E family transporter [Gammaproteobacteria bacterium]
MSNDPTIETTLRTPRADAISIDKPATLDAEVRSILLPRRIIFGLFIVGLLLLSFNVLKVFIIPVAWAIILAYVTWPIYRYLRKIFQERPGLSALLMTLIMTAAFVLPMLWLISMLRMELPAAYHNAMAYLGQQPSPLPELAARIPWFGDDLQPFLTELLEDKKALQVHITQWAEPWIDDIGGLIGDVGRNAVKFGIAMLTIFFIYRDGESLLGQTRHILWRFLGDRGHHYLQAIAVTTRAVVYGLVLTACAQGFLAGLGYWFAGVPAAVVFGVLTAMVALIPFGPPLVWAPLAIWLLLQHQTLAGIGLLIWGAAVVSWIDNLIRPLVISSATRIPFLLVMFGVLGGISAFGLIGLFLGPIIVAVLLAVWREWLEEQQPREPLMG